MRILTIFTMLLLAFQGYAQKKLTFKSVYEEGVFRTNRASGFNWMRDGNFYSEVRQNQVVQYALSEDAARQTIFSADDFEEISGVDSYTFTDDEKLILIETNTKAIFRRSYTANYYLYDRDQKTLKRLSTKDNTSYATLSPNTKLVAYVSNNNLYFKDLSSDTDIAVTNDGKKNEIINGSSDWVYEEEFYLTKSFDWSADSKKIAYLKFNESKVKTYPLQYWNDGLYPEVFEYKYPKAGEENSIVTAYVYDTESKKTIQVPLNRSTTDYYIPRMRWTKNPAILSLEVMNRLQNKREIVHYNTLTGEAKTILEENADTYIDLTFTDDLTYLEDGEHFLYTSEMDGYKHVYLYKMDGTLVRQITKGPWEVIELLGIDQSKKRPELYYTSNEPSSKEQHLYKIRLDGKKKERLTNEPGMHSVDLSKDFAYYIDIYSNSTTAPVYQLKNLQENTPIRTLAENSAYSKIAYEYNITTPEYFNFTTVDGQVLDGMMLKPKNFDPAQEYPVLVYQYSGPGSKTVKNSYFQPHHYFHQILLQAGYIVATIDNRGTGGKGRDFRTQTYPELGKLESEDHLAFAKYLGEMDFVDENRIGIWGWSYGGYMSSLSLFIGEGIYQAAMAVAPVGSWRFYDTIYTERYLKLPNGNAGGYDNYSPLTHAEKLAYPYLLVHGTGDDNVHVQNAYALQNKLISANKQFDLMIYPDRAHGIYQNGARRHVYEKLYNWVLKNL